MKIGIEEWRSIPGVDARYKVNQEGVVLSVKGEPLAANVQKRGYRAVQVLVDGVFRTRTVHSLVADAFLGKRPEHLHVNHKDGNKLNNHVDNLEYVTLKENVFHALATGLAHRSMIAMVGVCKDTGKGIWLRSQGEGRALGFHPSHIRECANGSRATHKNHTWSYA